MAITFKYEILNLDTAGLENVIKIYDVLGGNGTYSLSIDNQNVGNFEFDFLTEPLVDGSYVLKVSSDSEFSEQTISVKSKLDYLYEDYGYQDTLLPSREIVKNKFETKIYEIIYFVFEDLSISDNIFHLRDEDGFKIDLTIPFDSYNIATDLSVNDTTGGYIHNAYEGFDNKSYVSNVVTGCELVSINEIDRKFIPEISIGTYTINEKTQRFYSDKSVTYIFEDSNEYVLETSVYYDQVTVYKRDLNFNNIPYIIYKSVDILDNLDFTYKLDFTSNRILVSNKKINFKSISEEFQSYNNQEKFEYITKMGEDKGFGNGSKRIFYTNIFPIKPSSIKLFGVTSSNDFEEYDLDSLIVNPYKGFVYLKVNSNPNLKYYIFYDVIPRLDFEYSLENKNRSNFNLDLRPINNQNQTGLICINYEEKNIKKIKLNQERHLGDDYLIYKPTCNIGVDSLVLNAEVLNANNNPVEEIPVRFKIETLPNEDGENGYLNDSSFLDGVIDLSNNEGISRCVYYAPYRENSLLRNILNLDRRTVTISANSEENKDPTSFFSNEVFLYYIREIGNNKNFDFYTKDKDYVIFYEYDSDLSVYKPISPLTTVSNGDNVLFRYSRLFDTNIQKEQLKLYAPKYIKITASAVDPATGQTIVSNPLYIKLVFPNYLKGNVISNSQASYLGYGMPPQTNDSGTGLGGANYLTINPNDIYSKMSTTITIQNQQ